MKKLIFALALITFLVAVSYASTPKGDTHKHHSGAKTTHHIIHPVDHFII